MTDVFEEGPISAGRKPVADRGENGPTPQLSTAPPTLTVGLPILLEVDGFAGRKKLKSQIVGWQEPDFIICRAPLLNGQRMCSNPGRRVVVRYLVDGMIYGFATSLIRDVLTPAPLNMWVLEFPELTEVVSLRRHPRFETMIKCELEVDDDRHKGVIRNLSLGGALVKCGVDLEEGDIVFVTFSLPNGEQIEDLPATVMHFKASGDASEAGIRFDVLSREPLERIQSFLDELAVVSAH